MVATALQMCGQTAHGLFNFGVGTSALVVLGILWMLCTRGYCVSAAVSSTPRGRADEPDQLDNKWSPNWCYVLGCALALLLFGVQIYVLVLPLSNTRILPGVERNESLGRRLAVKNNSHSVQFDSFDPHVPLRRLQSNMPNTRTGFCADNDDWEIEPDIICPKPTWLRRDAVGRTEAECCDCSSTTLETPLAFCVDTSNLESAEATNYERNDDCAAVMRYAKCGLPRLSSGMIDEQSIKGCVQEERNQGFPGGPQHWNTTNEDLKQNCSRCYEPSFRQGSFRALAKESPDAMQSLCTHHGASSEETSGGANKCTYEFRFQDQFEHCEDKFCGSVTDASGVTVGNSVYLEGALESQPVVADVQCESPASLRSAETQGRTPEECCEIVDMCVGNTDSEAHPDVICAPPLQPKQGSELIAGRSTSSCCERSGYCSGNDAADVEDIVCPEPTSLASDADRRVGRTPEACCVRAGLCVNNTDTVAEPDVVCPAPAVLRDGAENRIGRSNDAYGPCCEITGMCAGNSNPDEDVECRDPWILVDDAINVTRGSSQTAAWQCCRTVCEADPVPTCQCGDLTSNEAMVTTTGEVYMLAVLSVVLAILRVSTLHHAVVLSLGSFRI